MRDRYILNDDGEPVPEPGLYRWGRWMGTHNRHLAQNRVGKIRVSTVFLGLDHDYTRQGPPVLWETMIFGGNFDDSQWRWHTRQEALAGHERALFMVRDVVTRQVVDQ